MLPANSTICGTSVTAASAHGVWQFAASDNLRLGRAVPATIAADYQGEAARKPFGA